MNSILKIYTSGVAQPAIKGILVGDPDMLLQLEIDINTVGNFRAHLESMDMQLHDPFSDLVNRISSL